MCVRGVGALSRICFWLVLPIIRSPFPVFAGEGGVVRMLETALVLILLESPFIVTMAGSSFVRRQLIPSGAFLLGAIALVTVTVRADAQHNSHRGKESGFDALPILYCEIPTGRWLHAAGVSPPIWRVTHRLGPGSAFDLVRALSSRL
jgi:hypothetical protein